jgi:hypothetical protein
MAATMTAVAGTKTMAATAMAGDTDNNQIKVFSEGCRAHVNNLYGQWRKYIRIM